ncbi:thioredoxin domain-containing protein [Nocardioides sp. InS609-2]|uniref:DsbA family protein n=1 Tax=Nocardioides sp. InS609-2 TaxID=2760705 RepID=UPI0020C12B93|nr:thioredoxin domain-containing protein [Nocardioides sp. InS609-2]
MSKKRAHENRSARAAEVIRRQEAAEQRRRLIVVGAVAAVLVIAVVVGLVVQGQRDTTGDVATPPAGASDSFGLVLGDDGAPHTAVVYEDFLCPVCGEFEKLTNAGLADAVEAGRVQVEYRTLDFLSQFGDYSQRSANAFAVVLDAAGPDVAKKFHDELFADQPSEEGPFPEDSALVEKAVEAGADESAVKAGIEDLAFAQWVKNGTERASKDGVVGTPTVMLDGKPVSGETLGDLAANLLTGIS